MEQLLTDLELSQYAVGLKEEGYDSLTTLKGMDKAQWKEMKDDVGMKGGHAVLLWNTLHPNQDIPQLEPSPSRNELKATETIKTTPQVTVSVNMNQCGINMNRCKNSNVTRTTQA